VTANSAVCLLLTDHAPWIVVKRDDKMRGRINAVRDLLSKLNYDDNDVETVGGPDPLIGRRCPG
jgi:polyphosphate kinase